MTPPRDDTGRGADDEHTDKVTSLAERRRRAQRSSPPVPEPDESESADVFDGQGLRTTLIARELWKGEAKALRRRENAAVEPSPSGEAAAAAGQAQSTDQPRRQPSAVRTPPRRSSRPRHLRLRCEKPCHGRRGGARRATGDGSRVLHFSLSAPRPRQRLCPAARRIAREAPPSCPVPRFRAEQSCSSPRGRPIR
jgi:hypothetical protein